MFRKEVYNLDQESENTNSENMNSENMNPENMNSENIEPANTDTEDDRFNGYQPEGIPAEPVKGSNDAAHMNGEPKKHRPGFVIGMVCGLILAAAIAGCVTAGKRIAAANGQVSSVINSRSEEKIKTLENIINTYYYQYDKDKTASEEKMEDGLCYGLMESLGDPYSVYYSKDDIKEFEEDTQGIYYGIGAYLSMDENTGSPMISGTIEGTPAEEADLRESDIIISIDDKDVQGLELEDVVSLVKGPEGTSVKLKLYRDGSSDYIEKTVKRAKIDTPTVKGKMLDDNIGYIQITEFDTVTLDQFTEAYATIKGQGAKGLILDLRSNPGGNVDVAVNIGREFLPKGTVVYTIDKANKKNVYTCDGENEIKIPLVVLVNGYTASSSEILTGAIKDDKIGTIVGTQTYGKGIVQNVIDLSDGTAVKLTISAYYTPSGVNIQGTGITPDVKCEFDSDAYYKDKSDNQLDKAVEIVKSKMK